MVAQNMNPVLRHRVRFVALVLFTFFAGGIAHAFNANLDASPDPNTGDFDVTWSNPNTETYKLQEMPSGGNWSNITTTTGTSYLFNGHTPGDFSYRLKHVQVQCSGWPEPECYDITTYSETETVTITTGLPVPGPITGPDGSGTGTFSLSWGSVTGATHYPLERRVDGGTWAEIQSTSATTRHEVGLAEGVWDYRVKACDAVDCSGWNQTKTVGIAYEPGAPGAITGPDDVPLSSNTYTLSWTAATGSVSSYQLEQSAGSPGNWTIVQDSAAMSKVFSGQVENSYFYRVKACNTVGTFTKCGDPTANKLVEVRDFIDMNLSAPASSETGNYVVTWGNGNNDWVRLEESIDGEAWTSLYYGKGDSYAVSGRQDGTHRYRLIRTTFVGSPEPQEITEYSSSVTTIVGMIPPPPIAPTNVAGNLPYDAGVTKGGNAFINVPIEAAPGVNGLQPNLMFTYGSGRDRQRRDEEHVGDILGYGWNLGGLSSIRRCVKGQDSANSIDLDSTDDLCLNGEPLVLVAGTKFQPGSEYRTYRESFNKVVMQGTSSTPWFEVHGPDGSITEFGNTPDSLLKNIRYATVNGEDIEIPSEPYLWSINRQQDAFGNVIEFSYHEDERGGARHPKSIKYGHNFDAEIQFEYIGRDDLEPSS